MKDSLPWPFPVVASLGADGSAWVTSKRSPSDWCHRLTIGAPSRVPAIMSPVKIHPTRPTTPKNFGTLMQAFVARWTFNIALATVVVRAESLPVSQCICGRAWFHLHRTAGRKWPLLLALRLLLGIMNCPGLLRLKGGFGHDHVLNGCVPMSSPLLHD